MIDAPAISLRHAQRALTRGRIRDAAGRLVFARGLGAVTADEIAQAAGVSRSTLYVHYPDQPALLSAIAADYGDRLCAHVALLPGPVPTRGEIDAWIDALAALIARERVPATLVASLAEQEVTPEAVSAIGQRLVAALGERLPSLARALDKEATRGLAQAWAEAAMRELGSACLRAARQPEGKRHVALVVASDIFERFVRLAIEWGA